MLLPGRRPARRPDRRSRDTDRREEEGESRLRSEHVHRQVARDVAGQHLRQQAHPFECGGVGADGRLCAGAARDEAERPGLESLCRPSLPVLGGDGPRRRSAQVDGRGQSRVLPENPPLELLQRGTRFEPELLGEEAPSLAIHRECLRLPAGAVEGDDQLAAQALAQRMRGDEPLELADEVVVFAEREVGVDPILERGQPSLFEALRFRGRERFEREIRKRRAAPQRERLVQESGRRGGIGALLVSDELLEAEEVDPRRVDLQAVSARMRGENLRAEQLPQAGDVVVDRTAAFCGCSSDQSSSARRSTDTISFA